ncbi:MAG: HEAT repeat domain-containing protein [Nitrospirota bacterium]
MDSFADLIKNLDDEDVETRRLAAQGLADYGEESVPYLTKALGDNDWRVRKTSVESFLKIGGRKVIESLISSLGIQDNAGARNSAIEALAKIGKEAVPSLINNFKGAHHDVRKFIIDILGEIGDIMSTPLLIVALSDTDDNVRASAVEYLGKMGDERAIAPLLEILRGNELWLSYPAAEALGNLKDPRALEPLLDALQEKPLREAALKGLGALGDKRALGPIVKLLKDPSRSIREIALQNIIEISRKNPGDKEVIKTIRENTDNVILDNLLQALGRERIQIRSSAARLLGWIGDKRAVESLIALLPEIELQDEVMDSLLTLGRGGAVQSLLPFLNSPDEIIRRCTAELLGEIEDNIAVQPLIKSLSDEDGHVRGRAALALGKIGDRNAIIPLLNLLTDEYEDVQESAVTALASIGVETEKLLPSLSSKDPRLRKNTALLLGNLKAEEAVPFFGFAIKDESPDVREGVVRALGMIGGDEAGRFLTIALTDEEPSVRRASAIALGEIGYGKGVDSLIILLKDDDSLVRVAAVRGLGELKNPYALPPLIELLDDKDLMVRVSAIEASGELGDRSALPSLFRLLEEDDPELRKTAIMAISRLFLNQALTDDEARDLGHEISGVLLPFLSDRDWSVRKASLEALGKLPSTGSFGGKNIREYIIKVSETDEDEGVRRTAMEILNPVRKKDDR